MAMAHLTLLFAGGLFMAIPVVLHLIMQQQPKQLVFPALRFVQKRRETNTRKMQLRHWILLALRCLAIGAIGAALARPSVASSLFGNWLLVAGVGLLILLAGGVTLVVGLQRRGTALLTLMGGITALLAIAFFWLLGSVAGGKGPAIGNSKAPVAAVIIVDNAARMQYQAQNQTRIALAQERARELMKQLPEESDIAILDAGTGLESFAVDRAAALQMLDGIRPTGAALPLPAVVQSALELLGQSDKTRHEIFVFTDLTTSAWNENSARGLAERLAQSAEIGVHIIDVGIEAPQDYALGSLQLSSEILPQSARLELQTEIRRLGPGGTRAVELLIEEEDRTLPVIVDGKPVYPPAKVRSRQTATLDEGGAQGLTFQIGGLPLGVHHGQVRIVGEDALAADDVRYFTIAVQPAWRVLVVAPRGISATPFTEAIAPYEFRQTKQAKFDCVVVGQSELANQTLSDFAAVFLLDPAPLPPPQWEQLAEFVATGGGLGIFLGHRAEPSAFNTPEAQAILPARLAFETRMPEGVWLDPRSLDHPVLAPFRSIGTTVPWRAFPVFRYWSLKDVAADTSTIIPYADGRPALVERPHLQGKVMVLTTPVTDPLAPRGREAWNELSTGENAWPYFILANEIASYLVSSQHMRLNYLAGETATIPSDPHRDPERYQLFSPSDDPYEVVARDGVVSVKFTEIPGSYRLKGQQTTAVLRGFSVNLPPEATDLTRIDPAQLDTLLGADRYDLVRADGDISIESEARAGREFFPWLMVGLALLLAMEHLLANRFYKPEAATA